MRLSDEEAAVAAYNFGKSTRREIDETDDTEDLVRAHILDLVVCMLTEEESSASFIEDMLLDESFCDFETPAIAKITYFEIDIPEEGQQEEDMSNDCGVWVASWMMLYKEENHYNVKVDAITRLRLALDLVMKPYNIIHKDIISKALKAL
ncbi:hypothetical protein RIF29_15455 [Crotalaria pallida]|uniref:Uncharacterized protein n=1 Tax=Crotalaria pallida TaxID=3830 RepID=A0AAN9FEV6_CROPI